MTTKVLPLERWMCDEDSLADCLDSDRYAEVAPQFNRPGLYLSEGRCWFELATGKAYAYPVEYFEYSLALLDAQRLTVRQAAALEEMVKQRLATKVQRQLLQHYKEAMEIRNTYRQSRKAFLAFSAKSQ